MSKEWTGERLETFILNETTVEHLHRYGLAIGLCEKKDVLDIASGEGYGSNLLSKVAASVTGVDISDEAVRAAENKYNQHNLVFRQGSASEIPMANASVDVVISFETIEHHEKHNEMLAEIKRVLKPGGIVFISSPDKKYYSDMPNYNNPFHVKELYSDEFKTLLGSHFKNSLFFSQKIVSGSLILPENRSSGFKEFSGDYSGLTSTTEFSPLYNICLASDSELPEQSFASLFDGRVINENAAKATLQNAVEFAVAETEKRYKSTWSYRIGHFFLAPVKIFNRS